MNFLTDRYERVPLETIRVERDSRQRHAADPTGLLESIRKRGVLNPIIVTEDFVLIAGERRYEASKALGLPDIPVRFAQDLSPTERQIVELEENLKRVGLDWRDEVMAIARLHDLYLKADPLWSQSDTAEGLCLAPGTVSKALRIARDIDNPKLALASGMSSAYSFLSRIDDRLSAESFSDLMEAAAGIFAEPPEERNTDVIAHESGYSTARSASPGIRMEIQRRVLESGTTENSEPLLLADFHTFAPAYAGHPFNFLHCDFFDRTPVFGEVAGSGGAEGLYEGGVGTGGAVVGLHGQASEGYVALIRTLCQNLDRLMTPSAHLMFWFGMDLYAKTLQLFHSLAPSLVFNPIPLVWLKSDGRGIGPLGGPKEVYETCFVATRESRPLLKVKSNAYSAPSDGVGHPDIKPVPVLRHFMEMFVDEHTRLLDPTCGHGSALRAAESLGAAEVLGLENSPLRLDAAKSAMKSFRALRSVS